MKTTLLASAPTKAELASIIQEFYCWDAPPVILAESVIRPSDHKTLPGVRVVERKGRYRFERIRS